MLRFYFHGNSNLIIMSSIQGLASDLGCSPSVAAEEQLKQFELNIQRCAEALLMDVGYLLTVEVCVSVTKHMSLLCVSLQGSCSQNLLLHFVNWSAAERLVLRSLLPLPYMGVFLLPGCLVARVDTESLRSFWLMQILHFKLHCTFCISCLSGVFFRRLQIKVTWLWFCTF